MSPDEREFKARELPIPIYLNQEIVFNLMAVFEDGFTKLSTLKTSSQESETNKSGIGASIGVSNVFALLGVSLSGEKGKEKSGQDQTEVSQEKVHTPTSLFAKCRENLIKNKLLHEDLDLEAFKELRSGDFVEIKAILRKNPIEDTLGWVKAFSEMIVPFEKSNTASKSGQSKNRPQSGRKEFSKQIDAMLSMVREKDTIECSNFLPDRIFQ